MWKGGLSKEEILTQSQLWARCGGSPSKALWYAATITLRIATDHSKDLASRFGRLWGISYGTGVCYSFDFIVSTGVIIVESCAWIFFFFWDVHWIVRNHRWRVLSDCSLTIVFMLWVMGAICPVGAVCCVIYVKIGVHTIKNYVSSVLYFRNGICRKCVRLSCG